MTNIAVIFPNNLFELKYITYDYDSIDTFIIVEDPIYFADGERDLKFNLLKLIFQRACMKYYEDYLIKNLTKHQTIIYLEYEKNPAYWMKYIKSEYGNNNKISIIKPYDHMLEDRIDKFSKQYKQILLLYQNPSFLNTDSDLEIYMKSRSGKTKTFMYNFYVWNRHHHNVLLKNNKPIGGKYSFDEENRKSIPEHYTNEQKKLLEPKNYYNQNTKKYYDEAINYCEKTFTNYHKKLYQPTNVYLYPITHQDAIIHFNNFIKYKLKYFGDYEDAIDGNNLYLFHSVISPQINIGLIVPLYCLNVLQNLKINKNILPAIEGYYRQLIWREYSRLLYVYKYNDMIKNYFNNNRTFTSKWYDGSTGIIPLDTCIKWAFKYGYLHHILRLMVVANLMNLFKIHPYQAYKWFMEFSLDSYDWVMINNVYSMGLYADGGLTTTKPYISSSNYLYKMSNFKKDETWSVVWNTLYYYFIASNYKKIYGRGYIYKTQWNAKNESEKKDIIKNGKIYIDTLTKKL